MKRRDLQAPICTTRLEHGDTKQVEHLARLEFVYPDPRIQQS